MTNRLYVVCLGTGLSLLIAGCSSLLGTQGSEGSGGNTNTGGSSQSGGTTGSGGASGGTTGSGGASGGTTGSGGATGSGGSSNVNHPPMITGGMSGWASRYWDCCKPACGWKGNVTRGNPMVSCDINDNS